MPDFIEDLLRRMSLTEKVGQLNFPKANGTDVTGAAASVGDIESRIRRGEVGSLAAEHRVRLAKPKLPARKASVWALSFRDTALVAADYYHDLTSAAPAD